MVVCQPRPLDVTLRQKPSLGRVSTLAVSGVLTFWAVQQISQRGTGGGQIDTLRLADSPGLRHVNAGT